MPWGDTNATDLIHYVSRNVVVSGRRTSMRLEANLWDALGEIAHRERCSVNELCSRVDARRGRMSLTAAVRASLVQYYRDRIAEQQRPNLSPAFAASEVGRAAQRSF